MTEQERIECKKEIDEMSQWKMAYLQRFSTVGLPAFNIDNDLYDYFKESSQKKGGMTSRLSKELGWGGDD